MEASSSERLGREEKLLVDSCRAAADAIRDADVLMLATGAGFSADSGLAVYRDIAEVPAYQERGLTYNSVCEPSWLEADPSLFYGFWGACFNDYRRTRPHRGYEIIRRWRSATDARGASAVNDSIPSGACNYSIDAAREATNVLEKIVNKSYGC